ncbi:tyrosinase superfamily protein [Emydomyces testavorans]|uniref:Tyrosinase superfamily protein n=1 Tax=Emydomyces testavorans TaxID=2070801 RepID=A0AAF0DLV2_9EURO|nr:tyrosinase superfamily protein [Emydomyces testavorans]
MIFATFIFWALLGQWAIAATVPSLLAPTADEKSAKRLLELQTKARENLEQALKSGGGDKRTGCSLETLRIRREWRALSKEERRSYIKAVYCLQEKPSLIDEKIVPGAKTLFDTFTTLHINQTQTIHNNTLREECGFEGMHPYWEWGYDVYDPDSSAIMDGSDYSLGSNGAPLAGRNDTWTLWPPPPFEPTKENTNVFPAGTGGGCVHSGPFSNMTVHFGPISRAADRHLERMFQYRPHCLIRDVNPFIGQHYVAFNWTVWAIEESIDAMGFQARITGDRRQGHGDYPLNKFASHGGGHYFGGGMNGAFSDFYASPQDPLFFPHHGQIDRMWTIWQWLDIEKRRNALHGTLTYENLPPSRNGTLEDIIDLTPIADPIQVRELMDVIDGPFCYFYE